jgi:hypothetical protein
MRAERKLGQLMAAQKAAGLMAKGTRGELQEEMRGVTGGSGENPPEQGIRRSRHLGEPEPAKVITLAEAGISKSLAHRARTAARMPEKEFEQHITERRESIVHPIKTVKPPVEEKVEPLAPVKWSVSYEETRPLAAPMHKIAEEPKPLEPPPANRNPDSYALADALPG